MRLKLLLFLTVLPAVVVRGQSYFQIKAHYQKADKIYLKYYDGKHHYSSPYIEVKAGYSETTITLDSTLTDLLMLQVFISTKQENTINLLGGQIVLQGQVLSFEKKNFFKIFNTNPFIVINPKANNLQLITKSRKNKYFPYFYISNSFKQSILNPPTNRYSIYLKYKGNPSYIRLFYNCSSAWEQQNYNNSITNFPDSTNTATFTLWSQGERYTFLLDFDINKNDSVLIEKISLNGKAVEPSQFIIRTMYAPNATILTHTYNKLFFSKASSPLQYGTIRFDNLTKKNAAQLQLWFDRESDNKQPPYLLTNQVIEIVSTSPVTGFDFTLDENLCFEKVWINNENNRNISLSTTYDIHKYFRPTNLTVVSSGRNLCLKKINNREVAVLNYKFRKFQYLKDKLSSILSFLLLIIFSFASRFALSKIII